MMLSYRAELTKLARRRVVAATALVAVLFAVVAAVIVLAAAEPASEAVGRRGATVTIEELADAGGGTAVFRRAAAFAGTFVLVVFVALTATEFSRGTMRTMLLRQPRRVALLTGRVAALVTFAGAALGVTEIVTWAA
ncbi:MAG: ABC transporter permease, partial [Actinomycetota bacterium]|nr:ABC transporter permease [Actinomycetota bacterium]